MHLGSELEVVDRRAPLVNERTRIVDEHVDTGNPPVEPGDRGSHRIQRRQVGDDGLHARVGRGIQDGPSCGIGAYRVPADQAQLGASLRDEVRGREAEPARRAGDDDGAVVEIRLRCCVPTEEGTPRREADPAEAPDDRELERFVGDDRGTGCGAHRTTSAPQAFAQPDRGAVTDAAEGECQQGTGEPGRALRFEARVIGDDGRGRTGARRAANVIVSIERTNGVSARRTTRVLGSNSMISYSSGTVRPRNPARSAKRDPRPTGSGVSIVPSATPGSHSTARSK